MRLIASLLLLFITYTLAGQKTTTVYGKVTEAETGTPIPFANVVFDGTSEGATTDFDGNFRAVTMQPVDSIEVRYIGYITRSKAVVYGANQQINFQLVEDVQTLGEVVIYAGENPAWPILRSIIKNKPKNDKRSLDAYQYEAYTKIEVDVDNISDFVTKRKIMQKISGVLDSIQQIAGEDGKPVLPIFMSEAISNFYYRSDPFLKHEEILKTKVSGLGITDGTLTSQVIGSTLQEYNFYQNWLNIVTKEFVSPIAESWKLYYDYDLIDSLYIDDDYCYRIDFYPRRAQDLAFQGTMWVTKEDYALKRIDATVPNSANLNFVEKIKVQQDYEKTAAGPWLPEKSRVVVDVSQVTNFTAGFLARFYISIKDIEVNQPKPLPFYQNPVSMKEDVNMYEEGFWEDSRHDSLSRTEQNVFQMIDTLKRIPFVKFSTDMAKFALTGYIKTGPVDLGPYTVAYGDNDIEGQRAGFGLRTNYDFSKNMTLGGYYAYGFGDERPKYLAYADFILSRKKWSNLKLEHQREVEQIWLLTRNIDQNSLFYTFSRFGNLTEPFLFDKYRISYFRQILTGFSQTVEFKTQYFQPQFDFSFNRSLEAGSQTLTNFRISEITLKSHFSKDEVFVINDNQRVSLGSVRWPSIDVEYTYGIPGLLDADLEYHRLKFRVYKKQKLGVFGIGYFDLNGGAVFGNVPYPLLFNTIGNETPVYADFAYNLMNFFEFSSDKYVAFKYRHSFEGFILNRIPLMKRLKWRLVGAANIVYGGMSATNRQLANYPIDSEGNEVVPFFTLQDKPYIEVGYGVENILKFIRVDAFHRLTYLNHPDINKFGVKISFQLIL